MKFQELAELCEKLESTAKRCEMVNLTADFIKRLKLEGVEPATCMLLGRPFPNTSDERLDVSWATLRHHRAHHRRQAQGYGIRLRADGGHRDRHRDPVCPLRKKSSAFCMWPAFINFYCYNPDYGKYL